MTPVRMDDKGRMVIPRAAREALNLRAGDVLFIELEQEGGYFRVAPAENPFDVMSDYAIREFEAGRTTNLHDFAASEGYVIDDDGKVSRRTASGGGEGSAGTPAVDE